MFIVTVPTPIDRYNRPDLTPLERASETVGKVLKKGDVVVYESTVYPGCTEEVCIPILERESGLKFNMDFFAGYSPERINPGDKEHRLPTIKKVTSGSTPEVADFVDELYRSVVRAGTHKASSIRVAEAAKVIENTQRDVNIALINELALIFNRLGIDTEEVLLAAGTKWNFLPFRPGLVGGHCIGVDPYYLTHKAQEIGFHPEMILAGRRLNDSMANYVAGAGRQAHVGQEDPGQGLADAGARPHVQGKLPGPAQLQGRRRGARAQELRREGRRVRSVDRSRRSRARIRHPPVKQRARRRLRRRRARGRAQANSASMGIASVRKACKKNHVVYDIKYVFPADRSRWPSVRSRHEDPAHRRRRIHRFHTAQQAAGARRRSRRARQPQRLLRSDPQARAPRASSSAQPKFRFVKMDLADKGGMKSLFAREKFPRVIHLAAQAGVRYSLENPQAYIDSNVTGTLNVLEGCRHNGAEHLVFASTSSVYGLNTNMPFSVHRGVDHPLSLYASTKRANELMAHNYAALFKLPVTGLRFFTVYGPWGRPDMALFLFTKNILEGKPIDVFNNGHHKRDFTFVEDIAEGVVRACDRVGDA